MRQPRLRPLAILILASLVGLFGGYVNEAIARDHGAGRPAYHRSAEHRIIPHRGHASQPGLSRGRHSWHDRRGGQSFRRGGEHHHGRSGFRSERRKPYADQSGGPSWRHERQFRRDHFGHRDRGWRERRERFEAHDYRRNGHWRDRRDRQRHDTPRHRYDHQYGSEIAPVDRSWNDSSYVVDEDSVVYSGTVPYDGASSFSTAGMYPSGARWIDVSAERLDRRAIGRDGIDVAYVGGSKLIRLAPDYSARRRDRRADPQP